MRAADNRLLRVWSGILALLAVSLAGVIGIPQPALALSSACTTLNSKSGTTSYSAIFAASAFEAGETVTISFTDNGGDPKIVPEISSGQIRLLDSAYTGGYSYSTYTGSAGAHSGSNSTLSTSGLSITVVSRGYLTDITIVCSGAALAPTVTSVSPASGSTAGGAAVTITGTDFTGATAVTFGGVAASSFTVSSGTQITATTPAGTAGAADIVVTTPAGSSTLTNGYTYIAPVIGLSPAAGTLTDGTVATSYSQTLTASGGTSPYTYAVTAGALPAGLTLDSATGTIAGTPTTAGSASFTITATDANGASGAAAYTLVIAEQAPVAGAVSATVAANSSANPITLNIAGGTVASVAIGTQAAHGTATASGTTITYTPTVGYSGTDSFTYTATNTTGTSPAATVTITVSAPTLGLSPAAGTLTDGTVATSYSQTLTASGGTSPYTYAVTAGALPTGLTLDSTTGTIAGTPTTAGSANFTITTTDANGATGSASYSLTIAAAPVTLTLSPASSALSAGTTGSAYSQTVAASGGTSPYAYAITAGALPTGLTLNSTTGTIAGTPTTTGSASFTITATDANGATGAASYSLAIVAAPVTLTLSPASSALSAGTAGSAYSQTVAASGGTSPYAYAVTAGTLPTGLTLDSTAGTIAGTPTATGNANFTVTATDANSATASASYSLTIAAAPVTLILSPASSAFGTGTAGTAYSQTVTASGGTAPYAYSATGLPSGLTIDASTGTISGTPATAGSYTVTVSVADSASSPNTGTRTYTLTVNAAAAFAFSPVGGALKDAMAGEAYDQQITATGGTGALIYSLASGSLPKGMVLNVSTGALSGPLDSDSEGDYSFSIQVRDGNGSTASASYTVKVAAQAVTVADQVVEVPAGSTPNNVYLNKNATGGPFTEADIVSVEPANAGTATIIQGELAAVSTSTSPVGWYLQFTPNAAYSGQARVSFRLTSTLGTSNTGAVTYNLNYDAADVAADVDSLVRGFVQTRQSLIASTIRTPGLMERRQMARATAPVTTTMSPSSEGMTLGFSTSLAQIEAARAAGEAAPDATPFNIWIGGTFMAHNREENGNKWGSFAMIDMGADYLLSEKALFGLSLHYDRMTDPTEEDAKLTGNGWLAGPYASFEVGKGVFWDTSLLYGGSTNSIDMPLWDGDFETSRWLVDTALKGQWVLGDATVLTPQLRVLYFSETVEDYAVRNGAGDTISLQGFREEQLRVSLGSEIARRFTLDNDMALTPKLGLTTGFSGLDGSGAFGRVSAGLSLETPGNWSVETGLLFSIEGDGEKSVGARVGISGRF